MNIIGIDLSLVNTGYVILGKNGDKKCNSVICSKLKGAHRLRDIRDQLSIAMRSNNVKKAVIEGYAYTPNAGRVYSIGELGGVIRLMLLEKDIPFYIVPPTLLKMFATGKGNSPKTIVARDVYKRWNVEFKTEHECDAYVLAKMGCYMDRTNFDELVQYEIKSIERTLQSQSKLK